MNSTELEKLIREIVEEVLRRIESIPELSRVVYGPQGKPRKFKNSLSSVNQTSLATSAKKLFAERDILALAKQGVTELKVVNKTIITPSARDAARDKGIRIIRESL